MGESIVEAAEAALREKHFRPTNGRQWIAWHRSGLQAAGDMIHLYRDQGLAEIMLTVLLEDLPAILRYKETVKERDDLWETLQTKQAAMAELGQDRDRLTKEVERLNKALDMVPKLVEAVENRGYYSDGSAGQKASMVTEAGLLADIAKLRGGDKSE